MNRFEWLDYFLKSEIIVYMRDRIIYIVLFLSTCHHILLSEINDSLPIILEDELKREMTYLKNQPQPAYYLEYRVEDISSYSLETSFGSMIDENEGRNRYVSIITRVGNKQLDNTHELEGTSSVYKPITIELPRENNEDAIRLLLWKGTHFSYRNAVDAYTQVLTSLENKPPKNQINDLSDEKPTIYYEEPVNQIPIDKKMWAERLKKYSSVFLDNENIINAHINLSYYKTRKYFVSSEGTNIVHNLSYAQLQIVIIERGSDGNNIPFILSYYAYSPDSLPSDDRVNSDILQQKILIEKIRTAPQADAYAGPAILSPSAAAVFFHEIFGHRIEGHRLKSNFDSQTFKSQVGRKVLPKYVNIYSDPTLWKFNGQDMYGYYKFDDQGIPSSRVEIVKNGILKNFLMSRSPIEGFPGSNGHGRSQIGKFPVSRQSNLIVEATKTHTHKELRKKLIRECKKQKKEYGLFIEQVIGGFTQTSRYSPNVFNVTPTVVYKIYTDGRPDELVKGLNFIGTPLAIFSEIGAMGNQMGTFTGYCGAESGSIPVTASSPALFIKKIETQKKPVSTPSSPILPRPIQKIKKP